MERVAFRPLRGEGVPTLLLASLAVSIILQTLFQTLISARPKAIPTPSVLTSTVSIGSLDIAVVQIVSIGVTLVLLAALSWCLRKTTLGIAMRAAADNFPVVRLMGINANRVIAMAFFVSGILAGAAAILWVAARGSVEPAMGLLPMFKAFIAAILGGLGSLFGRGGRRLRPRRHRDRVPGAAAGVARPLPGRPDLRGRDPGARLAAQRARGDGP